MRNTFFLQTQVCHVWFRVHAADSAGRLEQAYCLETRPYNQAIAVRSLAHRVGVRQNAVVKTMLVRLGGAMTCNLQRILLLLLVPFSPPFDVTGKSSLE